MGEVAARRVSAAKARSHLHQMTMRQNYWAFGAFCASYCRVVAVHHAIEDMRMFRDLRRADPDLGPVLDRLSADHEAIAAVLTEVDDALVAMIKDPTTSRTPRRPSTAWPTPSSPTSGSRRTSFSAPSPTSGSRSSPPSGNRMYRVAWGAGARSRRGRSPRAGATTAATAGSTGPHRPAASAAGGSQPAGLAAWGMGRRAPTTVPDDWTGPEHPQPPCQASAWGPNTPMSYPWSTTSRTVVATRSAVGTTTCSRLAANGRGTLALATRRMGASRS
jgi:hypothetical protein